MKSQEYILVDEVKSDGDIIIKEHRNLITGEFRRSLDRSMYPLNTGQKLIVHCSLTGIRVFTANVECPVVKGNFVFATEAHDDDGLPHTLEHLVFLGSEDYPYKGVLDMLANICLADGTNAYTDTDHTSYSLSTAGAEGFLNLLPIYIEHLLFPTLTDAAYITEVHHINGEGEDAGVVYCEMQALENTGDSRCNLEMLRSMYPESGYKSETGGLLENLRTSTSNEKVRSYHKKYYLPKNLALIITGPVEPEQVFAAIKPVEDKIVRKRMHEIPFERPWMTPVKPLESSICRTIEYSCDTEDDGLVYIGFRGPNVGEEYETLAALVLLLEYLNNTAIAPIQQAFVECEDSYCSSISHGILENSTSCFFLVFESVGDEYIDKCLDKLLDLISKLVQEQNIDMTRMSTIISRKILNILSSVETSPHSSVNHQVVGYFLYGDGNLKQRCQKAECLRQFLTKDKSFWLNLLKKYILDPETARYVCIVGKPSKTLMVTSGNAEKQRVETQRTSFGDKLSELGAKLAAAIEANDRSAPKEVLSMISAPSTESIRFHPIERVVVENCLNYRLHYDSIKTSFITIQMMLNTSQLLNAEERLYLPLLCECLLESPIQDDDSELTYEEFVAKLFRETVSYGTSIGLSSSSCFSAGPFSMLFNVSMQVEPSKYRAAVDLYRQILCSTKFTPERVKTIATRMFSDISQYKRSGGKVVQAALECLLFKSNSNYWSANFLRQQTFLKQTLDILKKQPELITSRLTSIRDRVCRSENVMLHITLDKDKIDTCSIHLPWDELAASMLNQTRGGSEKLKISNIVPCKELINPSTVSQAIIIGIGSVESNFLYQTVPSLDSLSHPDLPKLYVLIQYLTQLEGPLYRRLRGLGLSYSYSIYINASNGLLHLTLYRSSQLIEAYSETKKIVYRIIEGEDDFDDNSLQAAKSSLIFEFIRREKSAAGRSMQSLVAYLRNQDIDFNRQLINKVATVTKEDLREIGPKYLRDLFESQNRRTVVCCNPTKVETLTNDLSKFNLNFSRLKLEEESMLNSLNP